MAIQNLRFQLIALQIWCLVPKLFIQVYSRVLGARNSRFKNGMNMCKGAAVMDKAAVGGHGKVNE